jgi:hypothetical protein
MRIGNVHKDLNAKLRLENMFRPNLRRLHQKMTRRFTQEIAASGTIVDFQAEFGDELEGILLKHYNRTTNAFTLRVDDEAKARKADVHIVVNEFMKVRSVRQARAIHATTSKNAILALQLAREAGVANQLTELEIATNAGALFRAKLNGRESGILMLETQAPAETAKLSRVEILAGEEPSIAGGNVRASNKATKEWANLGDSRVRFGEFDHLQAEQTVPVNEPFNVSGEQLMHPGDTSRGASLGNVVGCRCSAVYEIAA